jgi:hypothetical protein
MGMTQTSTAAPSNNRRSIKTSVAEFMIEQRNAGFADNDGRWVVSQLPELFWSNIGTLRTRRAGRFLGVFDDMTAVDAAIAAAQPMPEIDTPVLSMGRSSS